MSDEERKDERVICKRSSETWTWKMTYTGMMKRTEGII